MARKRQIRLMEYLWITLAVITLALFVVDLIKVGLKSSYTFLLLSIISFLMYLWRRALRKKEEQEDNS